MKISPKIGVILMVPLLLVIIVSALEVIDFDSDGDGVIDMYDLCSNTSSDYLSLPNFTFAMNRFIWTYGANFTTREASGRGMLLVSSDITMAQTHGCSCKQILDARQTNAEMLNQYQSGCNKGTIQNWINKR